MHSPLVDNAAALKIVNEFNTAFVKSKDESKWDISGIPGREAAYLSFDIEKRGPHVDHNIASIGAVLVHEKGDQFKVLKTFRVNIEHGDLDREDEKTCIAEFWNKLKPEVLTALQTDKVRPPVAVRKLQEFLEYVDHADVRNLELLVDYPSFDMVHLEHWFRKYGGVLPETATAMERNSFSWLGGQIRWEVHCDALTEALGVDKRRVVELLDCVVGPKTHLPDEDAMRNYYQLWVARRLHEHIRSLARYGVKRKAEDEATADEEEAATAATQPPPSKKAKHDD